MALSQLARLALNSVSESPPHKRASTCLLVAEALDGECGDLAQLAKATAHKFQDFAETENDLLNQLNN